MAVIQLKRKLTGVAAAPPATANAGEPFFSVPGFTGGGPNSLYIDNGTNIIALVDNNRQVEVTGDQSVAGVKTITGTIALGGVANVTVGDGTAGQHLIKGAGSAMTWSDVADTAVVHDTSLTGDGSTGTPLGVVQATTTLLGGAMVSTAALVAAGANDATMVSPLALRSEMGGPASSLPTTAKTVVPAIIEMYNAITALTGVIVFAGTYDATTNEGTFNGQAGIPAGAAPLPAASAANHGAYVIVTVAGPGGVAPEPGGPIAIGDWIVSDGAAWVLLTFGAQAAITAANVAVSPGVPTTTDTDVQTSLEAIHALAIAPILTVATTFSGDGVATPLDLLLADGGVFA